MKKKNFHKKKILQGTIKKHPDGFGFVIPDDSTHPDVYIPSNFINSAFTNDIVTVSVQSRRGKPNHFFGAIESIVKRSKEFVVGTYEIIDGKEIIKNHNLSCDEYIIVKNPNSIPVKEQDSIKIKIIQYPEDRKDFIGEIIKNLGLITSSAKDDIKRILSEYDIPLDFPNEVLEELNQIPDTVREQDFSDRKDLREKHFITIDGKTAKDFDDAIYVEKKDFGYRLFVAIADVSHYVKENSHLDQEAFTRGNSTYLPNFCVPMLPEKLSNELCSLNPLQPRLVMVAELDHNFQGELLTSQIYPSVITSKNRLTYEEVQDLLDNNSDLKNLNFLTLAQDLAKILIKKHYTEGALNLEIEETNIMVNEFGEPVDFIKEERLFSHQLIEQFMLAANKAVSTFLEKNNIPFMYRIHEEPKEDKLQHLETFSKTLGHLKELNSRKNIIHFLSEFKNHKKNPIINKLVLRSLSQARYSAYNKSHYGLNFKSYTHFTSPIRRYCDLMIHRFIKKSLNKSDLPSLNEEEIEKKALSISGQEQNSVKAERKVKDIKKARFLSLHLGKKFPGSISSITSFGIFVSLKEFDIEGLIRLRDLPEHWIVDEVNLNLTAKRSGYTMSFGDEVEIQVVATNPLTGNIDFELLSHKNNPLPTSSVSKRVRSSSNWRSKSSSQKKSGSSNWGSKSSSRKKSGSSNWKSKSSSRKKSGSSSQRSETLNLRTRSRPKFKVNSRFKKDASPESFTDSGSKSYRGKSTSEGSKSYRGKSTSEGSKPFRGKSTSGGSKSYRGKSTSGGSKPYRGKSTSGGSKPYRGKSTSEGSKSFRGKSTSEGSKPFRGKSTSGGSKSFRGKSTSGGSKSFRGKSTSRGSKPYRGKSTSEGSKPYRGKSTSRGSKSYRGKSTSGGSKPFRGKSNKK